MSQRDFDLLIECTPIKITKWNQIKVPASCNTQWELREHGDQWPHRVNNLEGSGSCSDHNRARRKLQQQWTWRKQRWLLDRAARRKQRGLLEGGSKARRNRQRQRQRSHKESAAAENPQGTDSGKDFVIDNGSKFGRWVLGIWTENKMCYNCAYICVCMCI